MQYLFLLVSLLRLNLQCHLNENIGHFLLCSDDRGVAINVSNSSFRSDEGVGRT